MAQIDRWNYGDSGQRVKEIIDANFDNLNNQIGQMATRWEKYFTKADWVNGTIFLPYSDYKKLSPCIDLYIKNDGGYSFVYGGYEIKSDGVELQSDISYEGKVVVR